MTGKQYQWIISCLICTTPFLLCAFCVVIRTTKDPLITPVQHQQELVIKKHTFDDLLDAIEWVESRGDTNTVGDNDEAVGTYQIHKIYVDDVNKILKRLNIWLSFSYDDRWDKKKSREMIRHYVKYYTLIPNLRDYTWRIYDLEKAARIHNGGPEGWKKESTKPYWQKVKTRLEAARQKNQRVNKTLPKADIDLLEIEHETD